MKWKFMNTFKSFFLNKRKHFFWSRTFTCIYITSCCFQAKHLFRSNIVEKDSNILNSIHQDEGKKLWIYSPWFYFYFANVKMLFKFFGKHRAKNVDQQNVTPLNSCDDYFKWALHKKANYVRFCYFVGSVLILSQCHKNRFFIYDGVEGLCTL